MSLLTGYTDIGLDENSFTFDYTDYAKYISLWHPNFATLGIRKLPKRFILFPVLYKGSLKNDFPICLSGGILNKGIVFKF